jgi:hypothetical protein
MKGVGGFENKVLHLGEQGHVEAFHEMRVLDIATQVSAGVLLIQKNGSS